MKIMLVKFYDKFLRLFAVVGVVVNLFFILPPLARAQTEDPDVRVPEKVHREETSRASSPRIIYVGDPEADSDPGSDDVQPAPVTPMVSRPIPSLPPARNKKSHPVEATMPQPPEHVEPATAAPSPRKQNFETYGTPVYVPPPTPEPIYRATPQPVLTDTASAPPVATSGRRPEAPVDSAQLLKDLDIKGVRGLVESNDPKKLVYYLEVRANSTLYLQKTPTFNDKMVGQLLPGQMIRINDNVQGFMDKLRLEQKGIGTFKKTPVFSEEKVSEMTAKPTYYYLYDDFRSGYTLSPFEHPVRLGLNLPMGSVTTHLYSTPGPWTAADCARNKNLCLEIIDPYAEIFLIDTRLALRKQGPVQNQQSIDLYYLVAFEFRQSDGSIKRGAGWASSRFFLRKVDSLATQMTAARIPSADDYVMLPNSDTKNLYVFSGNFKNTDSLNRFTKNMSAKKARELASLWSINLAWDAGVEAADVSIKHSWIDDQIKIQGASLFLSVAAPIFLDLEIKGTGKVTLPVVSQPTQYKPVIVKTEEWLEFTTPVRVDEHPFKIGLGAYYLTMTNTDGTYGVNSLLGAQLRLFYDHPRFWTYVKYAPIGASLNFSPSNRDVGMGVGYKIKSTKVFDGLGIYGEMTDMSFTSLTGNKTTIHQVGLGALISF